VHGALAVAAVTVQDSVGVAAVRPTDPELLLAQIDAVLTDLPVAAAKTGLLPTPASVEAVASVAARLGPLVVDPVLRASVGADLADAGVADALRRRLLPAAAVVTPNLAEASALTGTPVESLHDARRAARRLLEAGCAAAVVTGGHLPGGRVVDVVAAGDECAELAADRVATPNTRGTGCTHSAALAAFLARGLGLFDAAAAAQDLVVGSLRRGRDWSLGRGAGPVDPIGLPGPG
jgi:hydroxymethylpyrimidine/phosphomethylpyrimidine kinase